MIVQHAQSDCRLGRCYAQVESALLPQELADSLIGIAVSEGKINLNDLLQKLGIDDDHLSLTALEKQATGA